MIEFKLRETDEFIKLGQLMKVTDLVDSGVEAKEEILSGNVKYNGEVCEMRGKKVYRGDVIDFGDSQVKVI